MSPVPAVYRDISSLDGWGHFRPICSLWGECRVSSHWPMGRWGGDGVHRLVRDLHQGLLGAAQAAVPRKGALLVVKLALLPFIQLPHGVVPHGPPLLLRCSRPSLLMARGGHTADTVRSSLAVSWECSVTFRVAGHNLGSVAWHIPWQCLIRNYSKIKKKLQKWKKM